MKSNYAFQKRKKMYSGIKLIECEKNRLNKK